MLIPTHEHAATLPYAVGSVQRQGIDDLEILIVGDGVNDAVRATVASLRSGDARIRFFDLPKGPNHGELRRDEVLRQARGRIVCYQADDDLWLPGHLAALEQALADADFAGALQVNVDADDRARVHFFDLERAEFTGPWLAWRPSELGAWACGGFGLAFAAHRLEAYRRLPEGWTTTPPGLPTDQFMWHKFVRQPWCRARFVRWPVSLHFPAPDRRGWAPERRADELRRWSEIAAGADGGSRICRDILTDLSERLWRQGVLDAAGRAAGAAAEARAAQAEARAAQAQARVAAEAEAHAGALAVARAMLEAERAGRLAAEKELVLVLRSQSWRLTAPLRAARAALRRLRARPEPGAR